MRTLLALSLLLTILACQKDELAGHDHAATATEPVRAQIAGGVQEVTIDVGAEYLPSQIHVQKGVPVRLKLVRSGKAGCGDEILVPALKLRKAVPDNATTIVDLPAPSGEAIEFTCGMKMMKGKLIVQ